MISAIANPASSRMPLLQFLPQRPLTPAEARDVLAPTLQGLAFLHGDGLVHGHVRPSNILAIDDQLKLSSDGVFSIDEHAEQGHLPAAEPRQSIFPAGMRHVSPYDPPEIAKGIISPAGDVWSLGITLVEALTQHSPRSARARKIPSSQTRCPQFFSISRATACIAIHSAAGPSWKLPRV